jgi:glycosyltransferase involved in cell wall biosynthesis
VITALAGVRRSASLSAVLGREPQLARPQLLDEELRARLRVVGADGVRWRRVPELLAHAVAETLRARPSLVVCGHVNYAAPAHWLARAAGARWISVLYGVEAWNVRGAATRRSLAAADLTISISAFTAAQALRTLPLDRKRVAVLPNAVDTARFTPGAPSAVVERKLAHLPHPRLLTVCRLNAAEQYKGVDVVIEALTRLDPRPSYLVVGSGTALSELRELAERRGVTVEFYGRAADEELTDLYRACDLFVMPSRNEGFGYVFIEALACGLPVIAGGVDGSVDALAGGQLGLLVDPFDPGAVAAAIQAQLSGATPAPLRDPVHLHAEVSSRFSPDAFAQRLTALLDPGRW